MGLGAAVGDPPVPVLLVLGDLVGASAVLVLGDALGDPPLKMVLGDLEGTPPVSLMYPPPVPVLGA